MNIALYIHHPDVEAWRFTEKQVETLQESLPGDRIIWVQTEADFINILPDVDAAVVWRFEASWFDLVKNLKWLATPAAGRDHLPPNPPDGVTYSFGRFHGIIMSETVLGMMLFACRNLPGWTGPLRDAPWPQAAVAAPMRLLARSRVLLCGFGPIGQAVGYRLKQQFVELTVIRRTPSEKPAWMDKRDRFITAEEADRDNAWSSADHIVLVLPGGEETRGFLSADRLSRCAPDCWIYNVGRGSCIDEAALSQCLETRSIGGAFLDVFEQEPLPGDSPLRRLDNAHLLPHVSAVSKDYLPLFMDELIETRNQF